MNKYSSKGSQGGFTLIELIVVIVILGILAATALPKFASLGGDARVASLKAAKGALTATASMVHGKYLVNPSAYTGANNKITVEGTAVTLDTYGYPTATYDFASAAGLAPADYKRQVTGTTITFIPVSVAGTPNEDKCTLTYTQANATTPHPTYTLPTDLNCD